MSELGIKSAQIVQLCPVAPGHYLDQDGKPTVIALALVELKVSDSVDDWTGREIWPVICNYNGEPDLLRVWTPPGVDVDLGALAEGEASVGYDPPVVGLA
jgi:hypothetical protein